MKFVKEKLSRLTGETEVEFRGVVESQDCTFKVVAGPTGVRFEGSTPSLVNVIQLTEFAKVIDEAFKCYKALKPKLEHPGGFRVQ